MITSCTCKSTQQDEMYGSQQRVMNKCGAKDKDDYRCTVCLAKKTIMSRKVAAVIARANAKKESK